MGKGIDSRVKVVGVHPKGSCVIFLIWYLTLNDPSGIFHCIKTGGGDLLCSADVTVVTQRFPHQDAWPPSLTVTGGEVLDSGLAWGTVRFHSFNGPPRGCREAQDRLRLVGLGPLG